MMDVGISSACLYPLETEKSLYELAKRGVKNIEIFVNSIDELDGEILDELRRNIKEYDLKIKSMHPFSSPMESVFLFGDYNRRVKYLMDIYEHYFEIMAEFKADIFVLHGAILSSRVPDDRYLERYSKLYELGKKYGVKVAQENICYCKSKDIAFLKNMSEKLGDNCAFVLDLKQARRSNANPFEIIDALGNKIVHFHVSDGSEKGDCLPIGTGEFDFDRLFTAADSFGYNGSFIVELYRENYTSYDDLIVCVDRLKEKLDAYKNRKGT